jgi:hypothetical protein
MFLDRTVRTSNNCLQNAVAAGPHASQQGRSLFANNRMESVNPRVREHSGGAAEPRQPQQHSEGVIVLQAQCAVGSTRIAHPPSPILKNATFSILNNIKIVSYNFIWN